MLPENKLNCTKVEFPRKLEPFKAFLGKGFLFSVKKTSVLFFYIYLEALLAVNFMSGLKRGTAFWLMIFGGFVGTVSQRTGVFSHQEAIMVLTAHGSEGLK